MWIETLVVKNLGAFRGQRNFEFSPGCTVISGGNESGKTSLVEAVYGAFFGLPVNSPILTPGEEAWVEVTFHIGDRTFALRRDLKGICVVFSETTGRRRSTVFEGAVASPDQEAVYLNRLQDILGFTDGSIWLNSGLVRDGDLNIDLDGALRAWVSGSPRKEHDAVLTQLESRLARLVASDKDAPPGQLEEIRQELDCKQGEQERWEASALELAATAAALAKCDEKREEAQADAETQEEALENLARFEQLSRDRIRLEVSLVEIRDMRDRIRKHVEAVEQGEAKLERDFSSFLDASTDIEDIIQLWTDASTRVRNLERDLNRARISLAEVPDTNTLRNGSIAAVGLMALGWLACFGAGAPMLGFLVGPVLGFAGFGGVRYLDRNAERLRKTRDSDVERLQAERENVLNVQGEARRDLGSLGSGENPTELRREFRAYLQAREAVERARSVCASHPPMSEIVDNYEKVFGELQILDTQIRDLVAQAHYLSGIDASADMLQGKVDEARAGGEAARTRVRELGAEREELQTELSRMEASLPEPGRLTEDIKHLRTQERELSRCSAALQIAGATLRNAVEEYQGDHLGRMVERASEQFAQFTEGRYPNVRLIDDSVLEVDMNGRWVETSQLSRILRDQLLLALRMAVVEEVSGDRGLPLFLDEAFPGWDDLRLSVAQRAVLSLVKSGRQAVVLTADSRMLSWADGRIRLDGETRPDPKRRAA